MISPINSHYFLDEGREVAGRVGMGWVRSGHCLLTSQHDAWGRSIRSRFPSAVLGHPSARLACVSHTAAAPLSTLSLGKNVRHSSYSKQHPWCLISWVHFTPQWSIAVCYQLNHQNKIIIQITMYHFTFPMYGGKPSMQQKSVNHQSYKATLKFNEQFVHACFNLVKKWKPCSRGQKSRLRQRNLWGSIQWDRQTILVKPQNIFKRRKGSLEIWIQWH